MVTFFLLSLIRKLNSVKEAQLIDKIAAKDESALSDLYDIYSRLIYSFTLKILKDKNETEDLLQTIFFQIWNSASTFDKTKGTAYSWIITMSRNRALDKLRSKSFKQAKQFSHDVEILHLKDDKSVSNLDAAIANERAEMLKNAMSQIPEEQKSVLTLAYFEGYTQTEISEKLNIPLGTVKTRIRQALTKLEKILTPILN